MLAACAAAPLMGQDARQIADSLTIPQIEAGARQLPMPHAPGATIQLLGADYEQIIDSKGKIAPVLADTPVNVSFKVTKDGKEAVSKDYEIMLKAPADDQGNPKPRVIPEISPMERRPGRIQTGRCRHDCLLRQKLAETFAADLADILGCKVKIVAPGQKADISFGTTKESNIGEEGYTLDVTPQGVTIAAATPTGQYWGTRTLLQMLRQNNGSIPCGTAVDFPAIRYAVSCSM